MFNHKTLNRFVRDFSLPIQLIRDPYFEYYVDLFDKIYNSKELYSLLKETVEKCGGEEQFYIESKKITENVINTVKETSQFQSFNSCDLKEFNVKLNIEKKEIYRSGNDGEKFLSIDLKKANFNVLKYFDPNIILNQNTYEEFISLFTDLEYIKKSKYIRQVIFGNLNPNRQQKIQLYIMSQFLKIIENYFGLYSINNVSSDEIVIRLEKSENELNQFLRRSLEEKAKELGIEIHIRLFKLKQLKPYDFYVKEFLNSNEIEFKACPSVYMPQIYKKYFNLDLHEYDLHFYFEDRIAKFIEPLLFE